MRKFALILMAVFITACTQNQPTYISQQQNLNVSLGNLEPSIVKSAKTIINQNGLLELQVVLLSDKNLNVDYKLNWLDDNGIILRDAINSQYHRVFLNKNQEFIIRKVAQDKRARDFKIYINKG